MEATTLTLATGITRVVKGRAEDVGGILKKRTMSADDGLRTFIGIDGDTITVNVGAILMAETAGKATKATFGFARELETAC